MKNTLKSTKKVASLAYDDNKVVNKAYFTENKRLAKRGNMLAQFKLAQQYASGYRDVPIEIDQAIFWYSQAARQGFAAAYLPLAELYLQKAKHEVGDANIKQAAHYLLLLHDAPSFLAATALTRLKTLLPYLEYDFIRLHPTLCKISQDVLHALQEQANLKNDISTQIKLGLIYLLGLKGVKKDADLGSLYIQRAATQGSSSAQTMLASLYAVGNGAIIRDLGEAITWIEKALASANDAQEKQCATETKAFIIKCASELSALLEQKPKPHQE